MSSILEEHRAYLSDEVRLDAYARALRELVRPDMSVLDFASGTSILGLLACRAGAAHVYSIESGEIVDLARQLVAAHALSERFTFIHAEAKNVTLPEGVDLIVSDQLGRFGFWPILPNYLDARRRFLKPGGQLIPSRLELTAALVQCPEAYRSVQEWSQQPAGLHLGPLRQAACNSSYLHRFKAAELLTEPTRVADIDLARADDAPFGHQVQSSLSRAGTVHGIALWFSAQLSPSVSLTNSPLSDTAIDRDHAFLPLETPLELERHAPVSFAIHAIPSEPVVSWQVRVGHADAGPAAAFDQSTFKGLMLTPARLRATRPDFKPRLTRSAEAEAAALSLIDGQRSVAQIQARLLAERPDLFPSPAKTAALLAQVIRRHALKPDDPRAGS